MNFVIDECKVDEKEENACGEHALHEETISR
jgi:hypothetical protein